MMLRAPVRRTPPHGIAPTAILEHPHHLVLADRTAGPVPRLDGRACRRTTRAIALRHEAWAPRRREAGGIGR